MQLFRRSARMQGWLDWYAGDHRDPVNHLIHRICIPLIVFSAVGLLGQAPLHRTLFGVPLGLPELGLAVLIAFYAQHDLALALLAGPFAAVMAVGARYLPWPVHAGIFAAAWIAQFIGHGAFEKNRPSLAANVMSLFIAPAFLLDELKYHRSQGAP
ncbi:MAG TPA: Mpo1-like protein [Holophagaceae bacterium]|nr:Mpo1-like protein [Holophagaceae bacterium]